MKCTLCGATFDESGPSSACAACGHGRGCGMSRCPNCGFETPRQPAWAVAVQRSGHRLWSFVRARLGDRTSRASQTGDTPRLLSHVAPGTHRLRVHSLATTDRQTLRRLLVVGAIPGAEFVLEQSFPAYVVRLGYTRFAMDRQLADAIRVQ